MTEQESALEDAKVALAAVKALNRAHLRAVDAGRQVVVVKNGDLVRIGPNGQTVILKHIGGRQKVPVTEE